MEAATVSIASARTADDVEAVRGLFRAYVSSLDVDLSYQNVEAEIAGLPGPYGPPHGDLLLARDPAGIAIGCVGLRRVGPAGCCEMKRLYVAPGGRGTGLGERLVEAVVAEAERIGYREMWLDTLPTMGAAIALYRRSGFQPIAAYYDTPVAGTLFMARALGADASRPVGL